MKLYLLSQSINKGYDTYNSCVVCAENEEDAKTIHPNGYGDNSWINSNDWAEKPEQVNVKYIGEAAPGMKKGIVCASFNAG